MFRNMKFVAFSIFHSRLPEINNTVAYRSLWRWCWPQNKIPHKRKTNRQYQLKISVLIELKILYRIILKTTNVILIQCPFKSEGVSVDQRPFYRNTRFNKKKTTTTTKQINKQTNKQKQNKTKNRSKIRHLYMFCNCRHSLARCGKQNCLVLLRCL